jgi:hypothetical protein
MKSIWMNKKHGKKEFSGSYEFVTLSHTSHNERVFVLKSWKANGNLDKAISFESWQAAKKVGWEKK